jgi:hypothetical protein
MARVVTFGCFVAVLGQIAFEASNIEQLPPFVASVLAGVIAALVILLLRRVH